MKLWALPILCIFPIQLLGQQESATERAAIVEDIIEAVNRGTGCELLVLWQHVNQATGHVTVRVFGQGEGCEDALLEANSRGSEEAIVFAKIPRPGDALEPGLENPPRQEARRPPEDFSLIHEVVEAE